MYMNGVRIGLAITLPIHRQTRQVLEVGLAACAEVAAGSTTTGSAECQFAAGTHPAAGATALASASAFQLVNRELDLENR